MCSCIHAKANLPGKFLVQKPACWYDGVAYSTPKLLKALGGLQKVLLHSQLHNMSNLALPFWEEGSYPRYWVWNSNHERWVKIHNMTNNIFEKKTWYPQRNTERGHDEKILSFPGVFSFFLSQELRNGYPASKIGTELGKIVFLADWNKSLHRERRWCRIGIILVLNGI